MEKKGYRKTYRHKVIAAVMLAAVGMCHLAGCKDEEALENQQAYRQVGLNKLGEGSYEESVEAFQKALDQSQAVVGEMEIDICYYKATAQYKGGDAKGALETCQALIDYDKKDYKAYYLRGCIYLKEEDRENTMKDYRKAFETSGNNYEMYVLAYESLKNAGWDSEAEEVLTAALKLKADKPEEYRERGHIYLLQGDYENAKKELDKAINSDDVKALLYLAQVYDAQGDSSQAAALYESYISKNNSDVSTLVVLGDMQMEAGNYSQALEFYQQALTVKNPPNEQQLRRNEIIACEQMQDFEAAREKTLAYMKDYPEDEEAQKEYTFLQTR
ncbi:tetratricopeptide repeat protein [Petralouisia muris]|jgi:tetratricopeptide (TPR) repeat protein|uniref:Tetratricopeptide repeat protein n=1 Tax=Petralouisia muris TaxID=3032872 RepID=A0AC61S0Z4_9FIRM|nr:tetratricopeptide repeat protein [Petralouisia muris]TGY97647.1 tetratricopeptide repeat protein [Petralouisia muris]